MKTLLKTFAAAKNEQFTYTIAKTEKLCCINNLLSGVQWSGWNRDPSRIVYDIPCFNPSVVDVYPFWIKKTNQHEYNNQ